ncbi:MAG: tRNA epoxyqueuosine(34) reductase QueG [Acidobacteria bacterium]|nr:tRNA epoxyqueuosine(34) reductase QueG [Acidobacteriota bacterium]
MITSDQIKAHVLQRGFDLCGIARADRHPKLAKLAEWIAQGRAGEMTYLAESADERRDVRETLRSARSVISVGVVYNTSTPPSSPVLESGDVAIARYARGDDYHPVLRTRLRGVLQWLADAAGLGLEAGTCVDDGPVQERVYAEAAGLGWIGKNTCLINPELGSWLFLGEIITNLELDPDLPGVDQCGTCTRCLDACPTDAIVAPYEVDATRCISYMTIEVRGAVEESWRDGLASRVFGCDICQDVCPWNRRAAVSEDSVWQPRDGLTNLRLIDACRLSDEAWSARMKDSALKRAGLHRLRRSMAYAAGALPIEVRDEALGALSQHPSAAARVVDEAIRWARSR